MKLRQETGLLTQFSISSLTDIVMLLLIFFLLSSSFVMHPGIRVQLPRAETGEIAEESSLVISLTERGEIYLNAVRLTLEDLGPALAQALGGDAGRIVVVQADRAVSLQSAVRVIDVAKAVGATRFMIATQPLGGE
ncbi:MAG: biopolymer transporter ExbD [Bacteroidota bacterium]